MAWYVVDGMDGSGKSTTARLLAEELEARGRRVLIMTHPNRGTRTGRLELKFLRREGKPALMMSTGLYILDILHSIRVMRGRVGREYDDVIFVRYIMAVAYLPDRLNRLAYDVIANVLPMPETKVLVDVEPATAMGRIRARGEDLEVFETEERLEKIRGRMLALSEGWIVLENNDGMEAMREQVRSNITEVSD